MKGPSGRLRLILRRTWECPNCCLRKHTDGTLTFKFCPVCERTNEKPIPMALVEDGFVPYRQKPNNSNNTPPAN